MNALISTVLNITKKNNDVFNPGKTVKKAIKLPLYKKNLVEFLPNLSKILKNLFLLHVAAKIYLLNFGTSELTRNRIEITRKNSLTIL